MLSGLNDTRSGMTQPKFSLQFQIPSPSEMSRSLGGYLKSDLRHDAMAGATVAVMGVPQAMAYALIAGLPPVYGLYTSIVTCIIAALFGSSNHLVTGPTNALCMVILSLTAHLPAKYGISLVEIVFLLTFMTGLIQLAFGLLKMGGIVRYVSNSVVVGFTAGAGILIAVNQLKNIMGVSLEAHAERFHEVLLATLSLIPDANPRALFVGLFTMVVVVLLKKYYPKLPGALIGVVGAGLIAYFLGWHKVDLGAGRIDIVRDIQPITSQLNKFHLPDLIRHPNYELTRELGTGALALAILGLIEAASIARAVASASGQRLNFTREFIGQGTSNIVGSFFSGFAASGSFTRTAVCYQSGGRTRMAAIFSAIWTAVTLLLFAGFANYIPKASLAGLLVVIAYSMIDKDRLKLTWRSGANSRLVLGGTLASTLILPLEYAIFVGVFLAIVLLLRVTSTTDLTQLVQHPDSGFEEVPFNRAGPSEVVTVNMEGDLYFAAVEDLDYELARCLTPQTRVVVLRMKRLRAVGSTAMAILAHYYELLTERGIHLVACGIEDDLKRVMTGSGLRNKIGEQNIFYADNKLFQSTELALARAWSIVEMERRRRAKAGEERVPESSGVTASNLVSRKCIRFGNQHQLREAIWLMSEMYRRSTTYAAPPLFLQDNEGRLAGKLHAGVILHEMSGNLGDDPDSIKDDEELGRRLARSFSRPISELAETDVPLAQPGDSLVELLNKASKSRTTVLPVCDPERRILGLIDEAELMRALAKVLNLQDGSSRSSEDIKEVET
ncbi:STAS domain-containing protein [Puniceicoccales bacterium CK1056]|uniref:STAS domain-containing protein n=1 Tax=Oceanipulchritudo coccoides TaxID=2706888 RepID=A0A6B2M3I3_9BACT|nr:SulP family inorganic anion transporter [Oceanipulchritudo coccoides]NDV63571.1 STAS domain-containing protein [Oceanipulchritudo coccoides]